MDRENFIVVGVIVVIIVFGFMFISNMTGNAITGSIVNEEVVENDLFKIDEVNDVGLNETNETEVEDGEGR